MKKVLVAEHEPEIRRYLETAFRCQGYTVEFAQNEDALLATVGEDGRDISLVLLDTVRSHEETQETLRKIRRCVQQMPVILLTAASSPPALIGATRSCEVELVTKPICKDDLDQAIQRALRIPAPLPQYRTDVPGLVPDTFFPENPRMRKIHAALKQISESDVPVLLEGESGVGKEVLARQLHALSPRRAKPFLKLNCAALPSELLESELFGYERGAFTGAFRSKPGKFELAEGGTVLLDEIGDMECRLQAKLLQVLQDHEFHRLGGKETVFVNVRIMAATHRNLEQAMREGCFREDLYYRLNIVSLELPALRERRDEILPLAEFFLQKHGRGTPPPLSPPLQQALLSYDWPGNIRELENAMRRLLVFRDPDMLADELCLKARRRQAASPIPSAVPPAQAAFAAGFPSDASILEKVNYDKNQAEAQAILAALNSTRWNRKQAAALLNIEYKALLYKMKKLAMS